MKEMKGKKIYDHIAEDIRTMITTKNNNPGGYVMPKLINLNLDPRLEQPLSVIPPRKANPNICLFAPHNE